MAAIGGVRVEIGFPRAVIFVAYLPIFDANRQGAADRQEVVLMIGVGGRSKGPQPGPIAHSAPIVSFFIRAQSDVIGGAIETGVAVGIGDPGCGLFGLATAGIALAGAVIDRDEGLRADVGGDMDELGKRSGPLKIVGEGF